MSEKNGYRLWSGEKGGKILHVGADDSIFMYTDIQSAIDAAQNGDTIFIEPGTYTLTAQLTCGKPLQFVGLGSGSDAVKITAGATLGASLLAVNVPVSYGSDVVTCFENIYFLGTDLDKDVISVDNGAGANQKLKVRFSNCTIEGASSSHTGFGVNVSHTYASAAIQLKVCGEGWQKCYPVYFTVKNALDGAEFFGMRMTNTATQMSLVSSADALAAIFKFVDCRVILEQGSSGGNAAQQIVSLGSKSFVSGAVYAAAATGDFTGSHTETIVN